MIFFKKTLFCLSMLLLICLTLAACGESSEGKWSNDPTNPYANNAVSIETLTYFSREMGGFQNATDEYYCGENIYMYVKVLAKNRSAEPQSVSMSITMENAEYLDVKNESTGSVQPNIRKVDTLEDYVISISGISFTLDPSGQPDDTKDRTFIFLVTPTKECDGNIRVEYSGSVVEDQAVAIKSYSFKGRENLDTVPTPTIATREDGFFWTDSPLTNIDKKLYIVQVWNNDGEMLWTGGEAYTKNFLNLGDIAPGLPAGQFKLTVKTRGDGISTKDSETAEFAFTIVDSLNLSYENYTISWDAVEGATKYKVFCGAYSEYVTENKFSVADYEGPAGAIQISVVPVFADPCVLAAPSEFIPITVKDAPVITVSGAFASWEANGATKFDIYINGEFCTTITETKYRKQPGENIMLTVVAHSDDGTTVYKRSTPVDISTD